jgi:hypothetical protein
MADGMEPSQKHEGSAFNGLLGSCGPDQVGRVVVTEGRRACVSTSGREVLLDDLDLAVKRLFPDAACCALLASLGHDPGHANTLFLIEDDRFWEREAAVETAHLIREATGLDGLEAHFVPRHFITKTVSGTVDRGRTLETWLFVQSRRLAVGRVNEEADITQELLIQFPGLSFNRQIRKELNSMGNLVLKLFCMEHGILYGPGLTLERIAAAKAKMERPQSEVLSIVALVDGTRLGFGALRPFFDESFMNALSEVAGCPVHFEQICVPPVPILLSDLIFHDYFFPKRPDPAYGAVFSLLRKIKGASLILVDDEDNFRTPPFCSYPRLDHRFVAHPDAALLGHRTQRYTRNHHKLARSVVLGRDIKPESINPAIKDMESYLRTPILKMAFHPQFRRYTERWDFCDYRLFVSDAEKLSNTAWIERFRVVLVEYIRRRSGQLRKHPGEPINRFTLLDNPHFCSYLLNPSAVDFVVSQYDSFCIIGFPSSLPYLTHKLEQLGKPYCFCSQMTSAHADYDCIILTGGTGALPDQKPTFDFMHASKEGQGGGGPRNVSPDIEALCPPLTLCNEQLFRSVQKDIKGGRLGPYVTIGNFLLNNAIPTAPSAV